MDLGWYTSYLVFVVPGLLIALVAQIYVKSTYSRYSKVLNRQGLTGADIARRILDDNGLQSIPIEVVQGNLSDHYDPRNKVIRLSQDVCNSKSVAALGIAAHEVGHAIQHQRKYVPLTVRNAIIPITQIGSTLSWPLVIAGLFLSIPVLINVGIILFLAVVIFQVITLPVEFNASSRAINTLESYQILQADELTGSKSMLRAAALTYVASLLVSILNLLRLLSLSSRRR